MTERVATRFERQARLPEFGSDGQARLERARVVVRGRSAIERDVATAYLARAGVGEVMASPPGDAPADPFPHADHYTSEAARQVGAGAWRALAEMRRILGVGT
jgi:hypothetical protein